MSTMEDKKVELSSLPPNIIGRILNKVRFRDAMITSILSRDWRYQWRNITSIDLNLHPTKYKGKGRNGTPMKVEFDSDFTYSLIRSITQYLSSYEVAVERFFLYHLNNREIIKNLDQWLLFLSRKGIKELRIGLMPGEYFNMPCYLFDCSELTYLDLYQCKIIDFPATATATAPSSSSSSFSFKGFLYLKSLRLQKVAVDNLNTLISSSPLLETIQIVKPLERVKLIISAPKLKYLTLKGDFKDIYLEDTPLLIQASLFIYQIDNRLKKSICNFDRFFESAPRLERLTGSFVKYLTLNMKKIRKSDRLIQQSCTYEHIKYIHLTELCFQHTYHLRFIFRLLRCSPNLEEIKIIDSMDMSIYNNYPYHKKIMEEEFWGMEEEHIFKELKRVVINNFFGLRIGQDLIISMIERAPKLEKVTLKWNRSTEIKLLVLRELLKCRRASPRAKVICSR